MNAAEVASWMLDQLRKNGCLYQDDVVDYLVKGGIEHLARENSEGNLVVGRDVLEKFRALTDTSVVWVKPDFYWRWRVAEDDEGREARG